MKRLSALLLATVLTYAPALAQAPDDALKAVNTAARDAYAHGREAMAARVSPAMVVHFDDLVLERGGKTMRESFTPPLYHRLKSVSHVPLGTVALLAAETPGERTGPWRQRLEALRDQARAIAPALAGAGFSDAQKLRLDRILADSLAFIDTALSQGVPSADALDAYARALGPLLLANATDAARAQLDGLHALEQRWRAQMSDAERRRLFVLVMGGRQPREGNLAYSYFVEAMGREAVGRRLIYAENLRKPEDALALLATIVVDRRIGAAFFDDDTRMERDLLADAAQEHLLRLFGRLGAP